MRYARPSAPKAIEDPGWSPKYGNPLNTVWNVPTGSCGINFEITLTGTPPDATVCECTSQIHPSAKVMPVSGDTNTPAGSMLAVNTVVVFPFLSICLTAGGVMIPASVTQIESP